MLRKFKAFTTVEILVAVGLVAILMVVAVPRLLGTRQSVGDSAAKQQLNTVGVAVNNWFVERDTFVGLDKTKLQTRVPEIQLVDSSNTGSGSTGKLSGGRALSVGIVPATATADTVVLYASNGDTNCWAIQYSKWGAWYNYSLVSSATACNSSAFTASPVASSTPGGTWKQFEFPTVD
jgi:type II secretory pathway pseudopilin PulG